MVEKTSERNAAIRDRTSASLLGRLKAKLLAEIAAETGRLPSVTEQRQFILQQFRANAPGAKIILAVLTCGDFHRLDMRRPKLPRNVTPLIDRLEVEPLPYHSFVEVQRSGALPLGLILNREELRPSGFVYSAAFVDEAGFPDHLSGAMEVRACREKSEPVFSLFQNRCWKGYNACNWRHAPGLLAILVHCLFQLDAERMKRRNVVRAPGLICPDVPQPPIDLILNERLDAAAAGAISVSHAEIPLHSVRPHNIDHCFNIPIEIVRTLTKHLDRVSADVLRPLLLYWNGEHFVASDDYVLYLAYRAMRKDAVPACILGPLPIGVHPSATGGLELVPPPLHADFGDLASTPSDLKDVLLDQRLQAIRGANLDTLAELYSLCMFLAILIQDPNTNESALHSFLKNHPIAVDPTGIGIESEVWLGTDYRIDLVVCPKAGLQVPTMIELERADHAIFTKSGRLRAKVTHAVQQVEDWFRWLDENPQKQPACLRCAKNPDGLVVIGRRATLSGEQIARLASLNANRRVKILTYDDLIDKVEGVIQKFENDRNG